MIDRESWERRWQAAPELRPEPLLTGTGTGEPRWFMVCPPVAGLERESGVVYLADHFAAALIAWRAVEWLLDSGTTTIRNVGVEVWRHQSLYGKKFAFTGDRLKALGAAIDAILEARK